MVDNTNKKQLGIPEGGLYRAFLLRCWQEDGVGLQGSGTWRFALVRVGDDEHIRVFASMDEMVRYLWNELGFVE